MSDLFGLIRFIINLILYPFAFTFLTFYRCLQWLGLQPIAYDHQNDIVLITGSANGLGREIAFKFAYAGATLALLDIDDAGNRETQQRCLSILCNRRSKSRVQTYHVDITRSADVYQCAERIRTDLGQVNILVANAGYVSCRSLLSESDADIERTFDVNALSPIWLIRAFLPFMLEADCGRVVIVSSVLGMQASHGPVTYVSSKHASIGLSRSLRLDIHAMYPNSRVTIHCICPYLMGTKMFEPMINHVSLRFLLPIVSPSYAASQVLDAIEWRRNEVVLPYHLKYIGIIKDIFIPEWLVEWSLFQIAGRQPLNVINRNSNDRLSERKKTY